MAIHTVSDAVGVATILYRGRDPSTPIKWQWWARQLGPDKPLADVTPDDLDAGIKALLQEPRLGFRKGAGVVPQGNKRKAPGTINKYVNALGSLYKLLRTHRHLPRSFVAPSFKDLRLPEDNTRTVQVTISDVHRLIDAARLSRNHRLPALIAVGATTGLRKGSLQGLLWRDVDLKKRVIDVARTKNGLPVRSVMPQWAAVELARIRPLYCEPGEPVFGTKAFKRAWSATIERAGIPGSAGWTFHHLRHVAASILAQSGASLPTIMQALNQKTPSMAMRYTHLNTSALDQAMTKAWG